jgi:type IV secretion system protein VirD4
MRLLNKRDINAAANIFQMPNDRTRPAIISTASSQLSFLRNGPSLESLAQTTISLAAVERGDPLTIYLVVPPDKLFTHGKLIRLWLGVLMNVLARRRSPPAKPTLLLIDEAAQLGTLNELRTAVTLMRGYGVKVWSFWQDLAQLQMLYRDWMSILNNCSTQQFFGATSPMAGSIIDAYLMGEAKFAMSSLKRGESVLLRLGNSPEKVRLPDYRRDAEFTTRAAANPFHARTTSSALQASSDPSNVLAFKRKPGLLQFVDDTASR